MNIIKKQSTYAAQAQRRRRADRQRGFTLLETIIAILILGMAIASLFQLVAGGLVSMRYAKDEIVATYLAQEALDHVRTTRDTEMLVNNQGFSSWLATMMPCQNAGSGSSVFTGNTCYIDVAGPAVMQQPPTPPQPCGAQCPYISYRENSPSYYGYSQGNPGNWTETKFRRSIAITVPMGETFEDATSATVHVRVTWPTGSTTRTRIMTTDVSKWPE